MPELLAALGLAALPAAVLIFYVYRLDKARPEPVGLIGKSVLYGFLAVVPAVGLELGATLLIPPLPGAVGVLFESFIVAGLIEESVKLYFLRRYIFRRPEFDERADGIVYAVCVSLGFAFVESFFYGHDNLSILFVRAFTAVPGHALFSGVMGYYLGLSKLESGRAGLWRRGLIWAVLLHGSYDAFLLLGGVAGFLVFPFLILGLAALRQLFRRARDMDERDPRITSYQRPFPPIL